MNALQCKSVKDGYGASEERRGTTLGASPAAAAADALFDELHKTTPTFFLPKKPVPPFDHV